MTEVTGEMSDCNLTKLASASRKNSLLFVMTSVASSTIGSIVIPGQVVGSTSTSKPGAGTFAHGDAVRSSALGRLQKDGITLSTLAPARLLAVGDQVVGRVTAITPTAAAVLLEGAREAAIPLEKTRLQVKPMHLTYRPGDLVRAVVADLTSSIVLSTVGEYCGVVYCTSQAGADCRVLGWESVQCLKTGAVEQRKIAKPLDEPAG